MKADKTNEEISPTRSRFPPVLNVMHVKMCEQEWVYIKISTPKDKC